MRGFEKDGNTAEVWHLSDKKQWKNAKEAYEKNINILFAIPLYVENVPGIMLEFLETLQPKKEAEPEYFSKKDIRKHKIIGKWIQAGVFRYISKRAGCKKSLKDRPYKVK